MERIGAVTTIGTGTRGYVTIDRPSLVAAYGQDTVTVSLALLKKPAVGWLTYAGARYGGLKQFGTVSTFTRMARTAKKWAVWVRRTSTTYTITLSDQVVTIVVDARGRIVRADLTPGRRCLQSDLTYARPRSISLLAAALTLDGPTFETVITARDK